MRRLNCVGQPTLKYSPDLTIPLLAKTLLAEGQAKKVIDEFSGTELSGEAKANLKMSLAQAYQATGNRDAAQAAIAAALAAKPDYVPAQIADARSKAAQEDISGALSIVDGILGKSPGDPEALMLKGSLLAYKGDQDAAMELYNKALQSKPDYLPAHTAIISLLMQKGAIDDAAKQLDAMRKVAPKNPQTVYLEAQLAYKRKDFKTVRDLSQQLLKTAPGNPLFLQMAGAAEYQLGSYVQAEDMLNKALQLAPDLRLARSLLVTNYLRGGQPAKALSALQPVLDKIDKDSAMLALAGQAYLQSGEPKKAEEYFAKASKLDPDNPSRRTSIALAQMAQGDIATATSELERLSSEDKGITADRALIASYMRRNELDKALAAIDVLQKKQPDNPTIYNLRARILLFKKDTAGARKNLEKALALNPAYISAVSALASLDMAENKPDDARKRFESVLATDPKNSAALLSLAKLTLATRGKPEDALALIDKAVSGNPGEVGPRLALIEFHLSKPGCQESCRCGTGRARGYSGQTRTAERCGCGAIPVRRCQSGACDLCQARYPAACITAGADAYRGNPDGSKEHRRSDQESAQGAGNQAGSARSTAESHRRAPCCGKNQRCAGCRSRCSKATPQGSNRLPTRRRYSGIRKALAGGRGSLPDRAEAGSFI